MKRQIRLRAEDEQDSEDALEITSYTPPELCGLDVDRWVRSSEGDHAIAGIVLCRRSTSLGCTVEGEPPLAWSIQGLLARPSLFGSWLPRDRVSLLLPRAHWLFRIAPRGKHLALGETRAGTWRFQGG